MSATASGSSAQPNGSASNRDHKQGNQERAFTPQQKAEVIRIRKCGSTSFYEILAIEKTASDGEIKKAYRKISLLTHPDKNGYAGADEAFKSMPFPQPLVAPSADIFSGLKSVSNTIRRR